MSKFLKIFFTIIFVFYCMILSLPVGYSYPWLLKVLPSEKRHRSVKGFLFLRFQTINGSRPEEQLLDVELKPGKLFSKQLELSTAKPNRINVSMFLADNQCKDAKNQLEIQYVRLISARAGLTVNGHIPPLTTVHFNASCANYANFEKNFVLLQDVSLSVSSECYFDNIFHEDGAIFAFGCRQNCICSRGTVECSSICKTDSLGAHCRRVDILGACCPGIECEDQDARKSVQCQNPVLPDGYPFNIAPWSYFVIADRYGSDKAITCGATLISDKWLLIAAHCVVSIKHGSIPPQYLEVYRPFKTGSVQYVGELALEKIDQVIIHPDYNRSEEFSNYDFALLRLSTYNIANKFGQSLNMPRLDRCSNYFNGSQCTKAATFYKNGSKSFEFSQGTIDPIGVKSSECKNVQNLFCSQIHQKTLQSYLSDGSGVFAKTNEHYDIIGLVIDENQKQVKSILKSYIRILSICDVTRWMKGVIFHE